MSKKPTIGQVAEAANVSAAAVSIAMHGKKGISEQTRRKILETAAALGYRGQMISADRQDYIAFLVDSPASLLHYPVLSALMEYIVSQGKELRVLFYDCVMTNPEISLRGCSLLLSFDISQRSVLDRLSEIVPKILILDGDYARKPFFNLRLDYASAMASITKSLTDLGHRSFLYLNKDLPVQKNLLCFSGFQSVSLDLHLLLNPDQIVMDLNTDPGFWRHLGEVISRDDISAIICTSEALAAETVSRLGEIGYSVPQDISVACLYVQGDCYQAGNFFAGVDLNYKLFEKEIISVISQDSAATDVIDKVISCSSMRLGMSAAAPKFRPGEKKIALMIYQKDHPSMRVVRTGFLNMVSQLGYQAEVCGISGDDIESYYQSCCELAEKNIDGVISWLEVPKAIKVLNDKNIPVVCLHGAGPHTQAYGWKAAIAADPLKIAQTVVNYIAQKLRGRSGSFAVSRSSENYLENSILLEIERLMKEACPNITILHDIFVVYHTEENLRKVTEYIRNTPKLLGAFSTAGIAATTWVRAKQSLRRDDMIIIGTDYSDETISLTKNGALNAFIAQPIYEEAQMGVVTMDAILRGNAYSVFSTLEAPLATKENVEKYERLLQTVQNWYV